jgi:hypothetical protein
MVARMMSDRPLDQVKVVQNRRKGRNKDDDRQHLKPDNGPNFCAFGQATEYESRAFIGCVQQQIEGAPDAVEEHQAQSRAKYQQRERELEAHSPKDYPPRHVPPVFRHQPRKAKHHAQAKQTCQPIPPICAVCNHHLCSAKPELPVRIHPDAH